MVITALLLSILFIGWQRKTNPPQDVWPVVALTPLPPAPRPPEPPLPMEEAPDQPLADYAGQVDASASPAPDVQPFVPIPAINLSPDLTDMSLPAPQLVVRTSGNGDLDARGTGSGFGGGEGNGNGNGGGAVEQAEFRDLRWAPNMRFRALHHFYPDEARRERVLGRAQLDCMVLRRDRVSDCRLLSEYPEGRGFGEAALAAEQIYRIQLRNENGERVYEERITLNAHFRPR